MNERTLGQGHLEVSALGLDHDVRQHRLPRRTPVQIALAWILAQKPWIVPIPGTTKLHRLEENIGAPSLVLTPDDLREIDAAESQITVQGARYPAHLAKMSGR